MRTPKRYQNKPIPLMPEDNVPDYDRLEIWCQRAKRKNRVKQLKRSIEKYKYGTHLRGSILAAYRHLQDLVEPRMNAPLPEWVAFMKELQRTQQCLNYGMNYAASCITEIVKRGEERKERE